MSKSLVGTISSNWEDMSPFLVHFTKDTLGDRAYDNAMNILAGGVIEARNQFGLGKNHGVSPNCVCFSETPPHQIDRLADKRGSYGIGFRKELIVERGGGPILYAYKNTPHALAMGKLIDNAADDSENAIWNLAPFIDSPGIHGNKKYFFEWEREWRVVGNFQFEVADPAFLIIPEKSHSSARDFFNTAEAEHLGPNYKCPFLDPYWGLDRVKDVLGA